MRNLQGLRQKILLPTKCQCCATVYGATAQAAFEPAKGSKCSLLHITIVSLGSLQAKW